MAFAWANAINKEAKLLDDLGVDIIHIVADAICDRRESGHLMCATGIPGQGSQPAAAAETPDTKKVIGLTSKPGPPPPGLSGALCEHQRKSMNLINAKHQLA